MRKRTAPTAAQTRGSAITKLANANAYLDFRRMIVHKHRAPQIAMTEGNVMVPLALAPVGRDTRGELASIAFVRSGARGMASATGRMVHASVRSHIWAWDVRKETVRKNAVRTVYAKITECALVRRGLPKRTARRRNVRRTALGKVNVTPKQESVPVKNRSTVSIVAKQSVPASAADMGNAMMTEDYASAFLSTRRLAVQIRRAQITAQVLEFVIQRLGNASAILALLDQIVAQSYAQRIAVKRANAI